MLSSNLPLNTIFSPPIIKKTSTDFHANRGFSLRKSNEKFYLSCRASSSIDYDPYDLLGIDSCSDQSQIKNAYRSLQKRCHPDIAGPAGHEMAIILNEAYSMLSDPASRSIYDMEKLKSEEFRGYTGKPLYSTWFGAEGESRAVFVDEVRCVGCLKCALLAGRTFAIESGYGRARVVGQWADPENKIHDAIQACPVDCISIVERSKLAALEFLMSKQPRGNVRVGAGNAVGARVSNIFVDVDKFESRFGETKNKATKRDLKETDLQREARISAIQTIRAITNWWYWRPQSAAKAASEAKPRRILTLIPEKTTQPGTEKVRAAAAQRRAKKTAGDTEKNSSFNKSSGVEYWSPPLFLPSTRPPKTMVSSENRVLEHVEEPKTKITTDEKWNNPFSSNVPIVPATIAAVTIGMTGENAGGSLTEHVGGDLALELVNSSLLQVFLAGVTWYLIGVAAVGVIGVYARAVHDRRDN
ncbi:chaperone protein dnaJ C76, chloroplastic [Aristolochia californica]|uniref:chaperone protein dnaJ C76, chloroplastic n=1 Tax=Aristolochia californica TaxID=171875 RepID=UPI0035DCF945